MAFDPQRDFDVAVAFTTKQQTDYATIRADADMDKRTSVTALDPAQVTQVKETDGDEFGKGHEFSTIQRSVSQDVRLARSGNLSSLLAGMLGAFGLGAVVTSGTGPYTHVFTALDPPVDGKSPPVTTMFEQLSDGIEQKLHSLALNDFSISGRNQQIVQFQSNWIGSGELTAGALAGGLPAITPVTLFNGGDTIVSVGPQGAPVDISERDLEWSITVNQNLKEALGYHPGSGLFRGRIWIGKRTFQLNLRIFFDDSADMRDLFLNNTLQEVQIDNQIDANNGITIKFPGVRFAPYEAQIEDGMFVHSLSTGDDGVFKDVGGTPNEPIEITVLNDEPTYLATV